MARTDSKRIVYVTPFRGSSIKYGFATNIDQTQGNQLGHTDVSAGIPTGYVFGANSPKPARASKRYATGTVSSFVDADQVAAARAQNWKIGTGRLRRGGSSGRSKTVYVTLGGINYAWQMPDDTAARIGSLASLGIREATGAETDLVFGATTPKPPRAKKAIGGTGESQTIISTFYDPSASLPAGWSASGRIDVTQTP